MTLPAWPFRQLSPALLARARAADACRRAGLEPLWAPYPQDTGLLRFTVRGAGLELDVAVAADTWGPAHWPDLPGLAWSALAAMAAARALQPAGPLLQLAPAVLAGADVQWCATPPAPPGPVEAHAPPLPSPLLQTAQGPAWIERAQWHGTAPAALPCPGLPMAVDLYVARRVLPLQRLRSLPAGAVLLLERLHPIGRAGQARLFEFDFTLETITVTNLLDLLDDEPGADAVADLPLQGETLPAPRLDVARLPVCLEVVLCRLPQTVADIAALQPGQVFTLPDNAWLQLQLRVNGQPVGSGELVQVGGQLGVQLHQAPVLA